jgi:cytochrome bd ubiquinol oxidase subunit I
MEGGVAVDIDPLAAMMTPAAFPQVLHMMLAAYAATGFAVAGIHAALILRAARTRSTHAVHIALMVGAPAALLQPISGDISAQVRGAVAAGEARGHGGAVPHRARGAAPHRRAARRGGDDDPVGDRDPEGLSLLAFHDPNATVRGSRSFPARTGRR